MYEENSAAFQMILDRKSVRDFIERDVEEEKRQKIYQAILAAPTTENMMMYSVISVDDPETRSKLSRQPAIRKAPMVLVFCADYRRWNIIFEGMTESGRKPQEGEYQLAVVDTVIAAQNAVVAAESLGIGSCYIGDVSENCERHREMLHLPEYVFPAAMLVFGYPTQQQKDRMKPRRDDMTHIVHENGYRDMDSEELRALFGARSVTLSYEEYLRRFCDRKYNSDFSREMTRSVEVYLQDFLHK